MNAASTPHPAWQAALQDKAVQTPAYVYAMDEISTQMRALSAALGTPILSVVAACNSPDVLARLDDDVRFGARCASRFEMNIVAGWKSEHLYLGMPVLDAVSARSALGGRFKFIIDAPSQIEGLVQWRGARQVLPVILSLSASLLGAAPSRGLQGMDREGLERALELVQRESIRVGGLHMYAGRHAFAQRGLQVTQTLQELVPLVEQRLGYALEEVNLGGGLEDDWWAHGHDFAAYRKQLAGFPPHLTLMHELGRAAHAAGGAFLTRVAATKTVAGRTVAFCDGGRVQAQGLSRADRCWYAHQPLLQRQGAIVPLTPASEADHGTVICGATGAEDDVLAYVVEPLQAGDLLAFTRAGAYMQTLSPIKYLGHAIANTYVRT